MSHSRSHSENGVPDLPTQALLVAPTVERAASLGTAFDDVMAATPTELSSLLITQGHGLACVVVTGIPHRGGRLASVVEAITRWCPLDVQILVDAAHPVDLQETGEALRGLEFVDWQSLGGVPCLRLRPAGDPQTLPDLSAALENIERMADPPATPLPELDRLQHDIADLQRALGEAEERIAGLSGELAQARSERDVALRTLARIRAHPVGLTILGVFSKAGALRTGGAIVGIGLIAAVAAAVGLLTDSGYVGAAVTVLIGLSIFGILQSWAYDRRERVLIRRYAVTSRETARRVRSAEKSLAEVEGAAAQLQRAIAVLAASSADTAASLVEVQKHLRESVGRGS